MHRRATGDKSHPAGSGSHSICSGHRDRDGGSGYAARSHNVSALDENLAGVGVVGKPPPKECRLLVYRPSEDFEPRAAELSLKRESPRDPFCPRSEEGEHDGADGEHLTPEDFGCIHDERGAGRVLRAISSPN